jgi:hypothetical protein
MSDADSKRLPPGSTGAPETGVYGAALRGAAAAPDPGKGAGGAGEPEALPGAEALAQALELAYEAARRITAQFGTALDLPARRKVSRAFDRALSPRDKRRGRKRDRRITAAVEDYEAGMRGQVLYQKHIPGYSAMGSYRRESARRRLNEAIRSRRRRDDQAGQVSPGGMPTGI